MQTNPPRSWQEIVKQARTELEVDRCPTEIVHLRYHFVVNLRLVLRIGNGDDMNAALMVIRKRSAPYWNCSLKQPRAVAQSKATVMAFEFLALIVARTVSWPLISPVSSFSTQRYPTPRNPHPHFYLHACRQNPKCPRYLIEKIGRGEWI